MEREGEEREWDKRVDGDSQTRDREINRRGDVA